MTLSFLLMMAVAQAEDLKISVATDDQSRPGHLCVITRTTKDTWAEVKDLPFDFATRQPTDSAKFNALPQQYAGNALYKALKRLGKPTDCKTCDARSNASNDEFEKSRIRCGAAPGGDDTVLLLEVKYDETEHKISTFTWDGYLATLSSSAVPSSVSIVGGHYEGATTASIVKSGDGYSTGVEPRALCPHRKIWLPDADHNGLTWTASVRVGEQSTCTFDHLKTNNDKPLWLPLPNTQSGAESVSLNVEARRAGATIAKLQANAVDGRLPAEIRPKLNELALSWTKREDYTGASCPKLRVPSASMVFGGLKDRETKWASCHYDVEPIISFSLPLDVSFERAYSHDQWEARVVAVGRALDAFVKPEDRWVDVELPKDTWQYCPDIRREVREDRDSARGERRGLRTTIRQRRNKLRKDVRDEARDERTKKRDHVAGLRKEMSNEDDEVALATHIRVLFARHRILSRERSLLAHFHGEQLAEDTVADRERQRKADKDGREDLRNHIQGLIPYKRNPRREPDHVRYHARVCDGPGDRIEHVLVRPPNGQLHQISINERGLKQIPAPGVVGFEEFTYEIRGDRRFALQRTTLEDGKLVVDPPTETSQKLELAVSVLGGADAPLQPVRDFVQTERGFAAGQQVLFNAGYVSVNVSTGFRVYRVGNRRKLPPLWIEPRLGFMLGEKQFLPIVAAGGRYGVDTKRKVGYSRWFFGGNVVLPYEIRLFGVDNEGAVALGQHVVVGYPVRAFEAPGLAGTRSANATEAEFRYGVANDRTWERRTTSRWYVVFPSLRLFWDDPIFVYTADPARGTPQTQAVRGRFFQLGAGIRAVF